jgi:hypothetical protein
LDLAQDLKLGVTIFSRTKEETFPSLKKMSMVAEETKYANQGLVKMDRQYAETDDPDQNPVGPES